jgi:hypothetical protein
MGIHTVLTSRLAGGCQVLNLMCMDDSAVASVPIPEAIIIAAVTKRVIIMKFLFILAPPFDF